MRQVQVTQLLMQHEGHQVHDHSITCRVDLGPGTTYMYCCANETVNGMEFHCSPDVGETPLVGNMLSPSTRSYLVDCIGVAQCSSTQEVIRKL